MFTSVEAETRKYNVFITDGVAEESLIFSIGPLKGDELFYQNEEAVSRCSVSRNVSLFITVVQISVPLVQTTK